MRSVGGVATAPQFTANSTAGSYDVTVSTAGVATPASFSLTNIVAAIVAIPTLNDWALVALSLLLTGVAMNTLRRRGR